MVDKVTTHYLSEKISKTRWVPDHLQHGDRFLTGSWDTDNNFVRVWRLQDNRFDQNVDYEPRCPDKVAMEGDITGLEFVNDDTVAVGCADGRLSLINIQRDVEEDQLRRTARSERLHVFEYSQLSAACTAIAVYGSDIATVGEDGCINILSANNLNQVKRAITADSLSLQSVTYVNRNQIVTSNRMGILRMFDARLATEAQPNISFMTPSKDKRSSNYASALATHPMQPHILICGSEEGSISVWDMRQLATPASYINAHTSPVNDVGFHRQDPTKLFTAADAGEIWMWKENKPYFDSTKINHKSTWLSGDRVKDLINVEGLITNIRKPLNSFDMHGSRLICGGDSEAVYIVNDLH